MSTPKAYKNPDWISDDLSFEILNDATDDPVVTIVILTPIGELQIMAEVAEEEGRTLRLRATHAQSAAGSHAFGVRALRRIAEVAMERMEYEQIIVEGAPRTTGANPGRRPRYRFARRSGAAPEN